MFSRVGEGPRPTPEPPPPSNDTLAPISSTTPGGKERKGEEVRAEPEKWSPQLPDRPSGLHLQQVLVLVLRAREQTAGAAEVGHSCSRARSPQTLQCSGRVNTED